MIEAEKASSGAPVSPACELLSVSRSGCHKWQRRPPSDRALADAWLTEKIREIHAENRQVYGAPRIHAELRLRHRIVCRLQARGAADAPSRRSGLVRRKRGRTTIWVPGVRVADDLVQRQFRPATPDVLWIADLT
jgi:putative transposase